MAKTLYKSRNDRMVCGVCAGLADYLDVDPTVVRVVWALLALSGPALIAYIVAAIALPYQEDSGGDAKP